MYFRVRPFKALKEFNKILKSIPKLTGNQSREASTRVDVLVPLSPSDESCSSILY